MLNNIKLSKSDLQLLAKAHKDNPEMLQSLTEQIKAIETDELKQQQLDNFNSTLVDKQPCDINDCPDDVYNVLWRKVDTEIEDTSQPAEIVTIVDKQPELNEDGSIKTEAITHTEKRYPKMVVKQWISKVNVTTNVVKDMNSTPEKKSKRAVAIYRHHNDKPDEFIGNYPSYKAFCDEMLEKTKNKHWDSTGTSGNRVAVAMGYYGKAIDTI